MKRRDRDVNFWLLVAFSLLMVHSFIRQWGQHEQIKRLERRVQELERITPGATEYRGPDGQGQGSG